jgi:hypothetical protein
VEVRNPLYERVKVIASVRIRKGLDSGFYLRKLTDDMRRYLSPWLYEEQVEVTLGGMISRADVLGFIERQSYIDFVTALSIVETSDNEGYYSLQDTARNEDEKGNDAGAIHASRPWSVLVTASRHYFTAIDEEEMLPPAPRGIDNLVIGDDFVIVAEPAPNSNAL